MTACVAIRLRDSRARTPKARTDAAPMITVRTRILIAQLVDALGMSCAPEMVQRRSLRLFWNYAVWSQTRKFRDSGTEWRVRSSRCGLKNFRAEIAVSPVPRSEGPGAPSV